MENSVNLEHIQNLTSTLLANFFHFSTIVFFYDSKETVTSKYIFDIFNKAFSTSVIIFNENTEMVNLHSTLDLDTIAVTILENTLDEMRNVTQETTTSMHSIKTIFIITSMDYPSNDELMEFFEWCWEYNMLNVLAIFGNQSYSYDPFPEITIFNMADYPEHVLFWNHTTNLLGYNFSTPIRFDPPRVFFGLNRKLSGSAGILYKNFVKKINGTLREILLPHAPFNLHQKEIIKLSFLKIIDASIHPTSNLMPYDTEKSYPISYTNSCVIVAVASEIDHMLYILYPFTELIWILFVVVILAFLGGYLLVTRPKLNPGPRTKIENRELIGFFADVMKGLLYQPLAPTTHHLNIGRNWRLIILNGLLIFAGFIFSNMYTASFTSLLSTTVYGKQLETVEDFVRMKKRIMMLDYEADVFINTTGPYPKEFTSLIMSTDADMVAKHRDVLNTTYAYLVSRERWSFLNKQQDKLWKPIFRIASKKLCLPDFFLAFPIQQDSPFYEQLKDFGGRALQSGLVGKWEDISYIDAVNIGLIKKFKETRIHPTPLGLEYYKLVWLLLIVGWILSIIVFSIEHSIFSGLLVWIAKRFTQSK